MSSYTSTNVLPGKKNPKGPTTFRVLFAGSNVRIIRRMYSQTSPRFGTALTRKGQLRLQKCSKDPRPIDPNCDCYCCGEKKYSRAFLASIVAKNDNNNGVGASLLTMHNLRFMHNLLAEIRTAILEKRFSEWVIEFLRELYPGAGSSASAGGGGTWGEKQILPPLWAKEALLKAGIRGLGEAFDWENGVHSTEDMPRHGENGVHSTEDMPGGENGVHSTEDMPRHE